MMTQVEQKQGATATFTVGVSDYAGGSTYGLFNTNAPQNQTNATTAVNTATNNTTRDSREEAIYEEERCNDEDYNSRDSSDKDKTNDNDIDDGNIDSASDLMFKKKEVNSRTQSFHSVLSAASLKSLSQFKQPYNNHPRNNSMSSTVNTYNSKNFQSFIQAPVLSSISNFKLMDTEKDIGKQLPFQNKNTSDNSVDEIVESPDNDNYDEELIMQQQKLTLNALKKLSLSPMPISKTEEDVKKSVSRKTSISKMDRGNKNKNSEPYQPAEVDLSSFASLTRQPKTYQPMKEENSKSYLQQSIEGLSIQPDKEMMNTNINDAPNTINANKNNNNITNNEINIQTSANNAKAQFLNSDNYPKSQQYDLHEDASVNRNSNFSDYDKKKVTRVNNIGGQNTSKPLPETFNNVTHGGNSRQITPNRITNKENTFPDQQAQSLSTIGERFKIPAAVVPPQNMNLRSNSNQNISTIQVPSHLPNGNLVAQPQPTKQLQQIKGFRSPMYVPAVLRFTKSVSPNKSSSGPASGHENGQYYEPINEGSHKRTYQPINSTLSRMASTDSMKSFNSNTSLDSNSSPVSRGHSPYLGSKNGGENLRGEPTRKHWIKDESVFKCGIPSCSKVFNFFERRHHCRKCGGIYCKEHTSHFLYINHLAQFTTGGRGTLSKVCDNCIKEYNEFVANEFGIHQNVSKINPQSRLNNFDNSRSSHTMPTSPTSPTNSVNLTKNLPYMTMKNITAKENRDSNDARGDQLVGSVPANWSWSSF